MRKRKLTLFVAFSIIVLTAFGFVMAGDTTCNQSSDGFEFVYEVGSRFSNGVLKDVTDKAMSVADIIPIKDSEMIASYDKIHVTAFAETRKDWITEKSDNEIFTNSQIQILRSLNYGTSFSITGSIRKMDGDGGTFQDTMIYYMTAIPAKLASYAAGGEKLIKYLKKNSKNEIAGVTNDQLDPGKISFVVSKIGTIEDVKLTYSCGYQSIDEKMIELIQEIPGNWNVATNSKGKKVDQELTFFFGQIGC
jgi:hypothetical protein